jgi:hypothetical protein
MDYNELHFGRSKQVCFDGNNWYNWATLFLVNKNKGNWPPGWGSLESETVKHSHESCLTPTQERLRWRGPAVSLNDRARLLVREGTPHQQTRNCLKQWKSSHELQLATLHHYRLTIGSTITLTLILTVSQSRAANAVAQGQFGKGNVYCWKPLPEDWWKHNRLRRLKCAL